MAAEHGRTTRLAMIATAGLTAGTMILGFGTPAGATDGSTPAASSPAGGNPAVTTSPATLEAARTELLKRIDRRLSDLATFATAIGKADQLTAAHRSALTASINSAKSGLTTLRATVASATTAVALKSAAQQMTNDFRVYLLLAPQVRLTIAADVEAAAVARLTSVATALDAAIAKAEAAGQDTAAMRKSLGELRSDLTAATTALDGVADRLMAISPGPDANGISAQVTAARTAVKAGKTSLKSGLATARQIRAALGKE